MGFAEFCGCEASASCDGELPSRLPCVLRARAPRDKLLLWPSSSLDTTPVSVDDSRAAM